MTPEAVQYVAGGTPVLDSWSGYRLATPKKRTTSPLDTINAQQWDSDWSTELTNLLAILTQLVDLEDQMSELLTDVIAAPFLTREGLATDGVRWPANDRDRRPRIPVTGTLMDLEGD